MPLPAYRYETREVRQDVRFVRIDGEEFTLAHVAHVLEGLASTDPIARIVIHDKRLADLLVRHKVYIRTNRGSGYKGPSWRAWHKQFTEDYYNTDDGRETQREKAERDIPREPEYRRPPGS